MSGIAKFREKYPEYNDMSDEQLANGLYKKHYSDMNYGEFRGKMGLPDLDDESGAPALVRAVVGKESDTGRRKAIIKSLYGEAVELPDGGLAYPKEGKLIRVNPKGFDLGDIAGSAREAAQIGTAIATSPATLTGVGALGSAAASAGAGQAFDYAADAVLNAYLKSQGKPTVDYKGAGEAAKQTALETGLGYAGGAVLGGAARAVKSVVSPVKKAAVDAWLKLGTNPPSVAAAGGDTTWRVIENAASNTPTGAAAMERARVLGTEAIGGGVDRVASAVSPVPNKSAEALGLSLIDRAKQAKEAFQKEAKTLSDALDAEIGSVPASLDKTMEWINSEAAKRGAGESAQTFKKRMLALIAPESVDAQGNALTVGALRARRSLINEGIADSPTATTGTISSGEKMALSKALKEDVESALGNDPLKLVQFRKFNDWYSKRKGQLDAVESLLADSAKVTGGRFMPAEATAQRMETIEAGLGPEAHKEAVSSLLSKMARETPSAGATVDVLTSPRSLLTNWRKMSPEVQQNVLDAMPPAEREIFVEGVLKASEQMAKLGQYMNVSKTSPNLLSGSLLTGGSFYAGGLEGLIASLVVPWAVAKGATSPTVIRAMQSPGYRAAADFIAKSSPTAGRVGGLLAADVLENTTGAR